jgi:hypothetical protein
MHSGLCTQDVREIGRCIRRHRLRASRSNAGTNAQRVSATGYPLCCSLCPYLPDGSLSPVFPRRIHNSVAHTEGGNPLLLSRHEHKYPIALVEADPKPT